VGAAGLTRMTRSLRKVAAPGLAVGGGDGGGFLQVGVGEAAFRAQNHVGARHTPRVQPQVFGRGEAEGGYVVLARRATYEEVRAELCAKPERLRYLGSSVAFAWLLAFPLGHFFGCGCAVGAGGGYLLDDGAYLVVAGGEFEAGEEAVPEVDVGAGGLYALGQARLRRLRLAVLAKVGLRVLHGRERGVEGYLEVHAFDL
jgi:hypothetical protein